MTALIAALPNVTARAQFADDQEQFASIGKCRVCWSPVFEDECERGQVRFDRFDRPSHVSCYLDWSE